MKQVILKLGAVMCIAALCLGVVAGCSGGASDLDAAQKEKREYMSKVNGIMNELGQDLESFVDAVSRKDVVNMRTQADNAYQRLDELSKLEAPEGLGEVQKMYLDGTGKLREALNGYIDVYTELDAGTLDQSTYAERIKDIQTRYDEGVELLKKADEAAAAQ